ncbi:hypothetical protein P8452_53287 [Trifolium repens]|nr:hypothetical protein P8452_53287 [Trifolium repens]
MEGSVFAPALKELQHVKSGQGEIMTKRFLDACRHILPVIDKFGAAMTLVKSDIGGNNFVSLPPSIGRLSSLAYLNLAHCSWLQSLPELQLCATSLSGGNYFKMISGSHNHRPGLYNCPLLKIAESHNLALSWMMKLIENPCHFRCGLDFVVHGFTVPHGFIINLQKIQDYE